MQFKSGVVMWRMHPEVEARANDLDRVSRAVIGRDALVTSARDGKHSPTSLHYRGRALDLRMRDLTPPQVAEYAAALREELGPEWDVVVERTHIHVEYDPKG